MTSEQMSVVGSGSQNTLQNVDLNPLTLSTTWVLVPADMLESLLRNSSVPLEDLKRSEALPMALGDAATTVMEDPPNQLPPVEELQAQMSVTVIVPNSMVLMTASVQAVQTELSASSLTDARTERRYVPRWDMCDQARRETGVLAASADWLEQPAEAGG